MSPTMILGRVALPAAGLLIAGWLLIRAFGGADADPRWKALPASLSANAGGDPSPSPPATAPDTTRILAEGHVAARPGAEIVVGAEMAGTVARVLVQEKSAVRAGDLLVEFRGAEIKAAAEEAVAKVSEIDAELAGIEREQARVDKLPEKQPGRDEAKDRLRTRREATRARRAGAVAAYRRIESEFARTKIHAPIDGTVIARHVDAGETVSLGAPLLKIADLNRLRIVAEIDEYDIPRCAPGCAVAITAPGHAGRSWRGTVEDIADFLTPRRIRPDDPGRLTDTRVLAVRIGFDPLTPLKLGQRVEVAITESAGASATPGPILPPTTTPRVGRGSSDRSERH
ncbi:p-hydroxybenzoic acid efflux pump subunit AaeA [Aquisphaera giovannonii]|uniref:p-hydroxybenzoic acid efflux pump subunit AaeA n=1 Tax=Aquisphaera giovannonii TaxID=406548 RepID=A0A5B9W8C9_9BACT|nr:efflux RND transporter periplasmic adaptor subunit [Aquisphaera giovannonii]QEH36170.1 p-hydroxybenzoic acid efflux pump subunit AaeA [Aquisphaera giovannonii]